MFLAKKSQQVELRRRTFLQAPAGFAVESDSAFERRHRVVVTIGTFDGLGHATPRSPSVSGLHISYTSSTTCASCSTINRSNSSRSSFLLLTYRSKRRPPTRIA